MYSHVGIWSQPTTPGLYRLRYIRGSEKRNDKCERKTNRNRAQKIGIAPNSNYFRPNFPVPPLSKGIPKAFATPPFRSQRVVPASCTSRAGRLRRVRACYPHAPRTRQLGLAWMRGGHPRGPHTCVSACRSGEPHVTRIIADA